MTDEVKDLAQRIFEATGEMRRKLDDLEKAKADGKAVGDLQASVDKANAEISKLSNDMRELARKSSRAALGLGGAHGIELTPAQQEYKQAFAAFLRKGDEAGLKDLQLKAMNSGSGPDGGYLVHPEMDAMIDRVVSVVSSIARISRNVTIGAASYKKVAKTSGLAARRVGDGATGGESTNPRYSELEFNVFTAEAEPWVFNETLDDAVLNIEADLADEAATGFAELLGAECATGAGVAGGRGITAYDTVANASYSWGRLGYVFTGQSGAFATSNPGDKLIELQHALKSQYRSNARWVMADSILSTVRQMKDGSGNFYLWNPDPLAGFGGRLLGSPVEVDDNMPAAGANSLSVAYGDFAKGYIVVTRSGTTVIRDNITAKGKTKYNFRRRFTSGVQNFEAIKLLKLGTS